MRHLALSLAFSSALLIGAPAGAQQTPEPKSGPQTTIEGRALGEHVSGHAPEQPQEMGALFGDCVAALALTGTCPHEETDEHDG